jgi:tRNA (guanine37-N1)-methyltransferase
LIDSIVRLLPGVLRSEESYKNDSHYNGLLENPQYTRPRVFKGDSVPEVLISGDHKKIYEWRKRESLKATLLKRPDLLENINLDKEELKLLSEIKKDLKDIN